MEIGLGTTETYEMNTHDQTLLGEKTITNCIANLQPWSKFILYQIVQHLLSHGLCTSNSVFY